NLTTFDAPLTVKYRAFDAVGFVQDWSLLVTRGNNFHFPVMVDSGVAMTNESGDSFGVIRSYPTPGACSSFRGIADEITVDASNYVSIILKPRSGNWLPTG